MSGKTKRRTAGARIDILNINYFDWDGERIIRGGAERYVHDLAKLCSRLGMRPRLLQCASRDFEREHDGIEVLGFATEPTLDLRRISGEFSPRVAGASCVIASPLEFASGISEGVPVVGINHGVHWDLPYNRIDVVDTLARDLVRDSLQRCAATVCVDTNFPNWLRSVDAALAQRLVYVPNYVDEEVFKAVAKDFDAEVLEILFPRRLAQGRGFDMAVAVLGEIFQHRDDVSAHLCGDGGASELATSQALARAFPRRVRVSNADPAEMPAVFRDSQIVIIPTLYSEGTSLSCIEAMATNNAVIATDVGGLPNLVIDEYNGLLIHPDAQSLRTAIERLLDDRVLAAGLANRALSVSQAFSKSKWDSGWAEVLGEVMGLDATAKSGIVAVGATQLVDHAPATTIAERIEAEQQRNAAQTALLHAGLEARLAQASEKRLLADLDSAKAAIDEISLALREQSEVLRVAREQGAAALGSAEQYSRELQQEREALRIAREESLAAAAVSADLLQHSRLETEAMRIARDEGVRRADAEQAARQVAEDDAIQASLRAERERESRNWLERQLEFANRELALIKGSTGWRVLQVMYAIRFALFPRGSRRESAAKALMRWQRAWRARRSRDSAVVREDTPGMQEAPAPTRTPGDAVVADAPVAVRTMVFLPIIEWRFRFQRPQQLAQQMAALGQRVLYARLAFASELTVERIAEGIDEVTLNGPPGANPYQDALDDERARTMAMALQALLARSGPQTITCVVQLPFWLPLALHLRMLTGCEIVYDCMDWHAGFSTNSASMLERENQLFAEADLTVVSSDKLLASASAHASNVAIVRNGADYAMFSQVPHKTRASDEQFIVGYYGAIADWFDSAMVGEIARLRPLWKIVLVGDTFSADLAPIDGLANVELTGEKPYASLPGAIAPWDCCIIPFRRVDLTEATNPVKVYEMLAAGKPVVAVDLPELRPLAGEGLVEIANTGAEFVDAIERQVRADDESIRARRRQFAAGNTWRMRATRMLELCDAITPLVSVVIVTYNNLAMNRQCLDSVLRDTAWPAIEVIVVDNASTDGTPEYLQQVMAGDARVRIVLNPENRGFAAANNQGVEIANGRYICLLNNDTVVHGAWLTTLVGHLRSDPSIGIVGPVTNAIGNEAKIEVGYSAIEQMPAWADEYVRHASTGTQPISMLAFFCVLMARHVWRSVGPLDERFAVGMFEDDDYNRRVRESGLRVRLARNAFVHHWQRASFKLISDAKYLEIYHQNRRRYIDKWNALTAGNGDPLAQVRTLADITRATFVFAPSVGWSSSVAQRPQHLARMLAKVGYTVVFDCSNTFEASDGVREVEPGLFLFRGNASDLATLPKVVLWLLTYNWQYADAFAADAIRVYDYIDDIAVFPHDAVWLQKQHDYALARANVVFCVARRLLEEARRTRPDAIYLPNAVEEGRFDVPPVPNNALDDAGFARVRGLRKPVVGYYGALARWFDYDLLRVVANRLPDVQFVLIGPDLDGSAMQSKIADTSNVTWLGARGYTELPGYLHLFDVAMIPFLINQITIATSPLKLYEFFAAGIPVVSTPMPECAAHPEVNVAGDANGFCKAIVAALSQRSARQRDKLRAVAKSNTWRVRVEAAIYAVHNLARPAHVRTAAHGAVDEEWRQPVPMMPGARELIERFKGWRTPGNANFFAVLANHFAGMGDDPHVASHFKYGIDANDRGRALVGVLERDEPIAGKRVLDVGSSFGGFLVAAAERGANPEGLVHETGLLALTEANFVDTGRRMPMYLRDVAQSADIAELAGRFDIVVCIDGIAGAADPRVVLRNIASMVRDGGIAYVRIANRDALDFVLADAQHRLLGFTQLDPAGRKSYLAERAPDATLPAMTYLGVDEGAAMLFESGLIVESLEPEVDPAGAQWLLRDLRALESALDKRLGEVPAEARDDVARAVRAYLQRALASPLSTDAQRSDFARRYGTHYVDLRARKARAAAMSATPAAATVISGEHRGVCNVCGLATRFACDDVSVARESMVCEHCKTTSRYRSIARGLLEALRELAGVDAPSLSELPASGVSRRLRIYDTQPAFAFNTCAYPIPDLLARCDWIDLRVSQFVPGKPLGATLGRNLTNQNLESLTFDDAFFDIVVTSDVMEHVRLDEDAHREIHRVLKHGGRYLFTVPNFRCARGNYVRVRVVDRANPGSDVYETVPEYHGDANNPGGRGVLSYRDYGTQIDEDLARLGFEVTHCKRDFVGAGIINTELFSCIKR